MYYNYMKDRSLINCTFCAVKKGGNIARHEEDKHMQNRRKVN